MGRRVLVDQRKRRLRHNLRMPDPFVSTEPLLAPALLQGWLTMAGLIVAIGAQNALVLQQGLRRTHVGPVVALCTVSDWLLSRSQTYGRKRPRSESQVIARNHHLEA